jgi:hypothetical protein
MGKSGIAKNLTGQRAIFEVGVELTKRGYRVLITSRNSPGPDLVVIKPDIDKKLTVQVKGLNSSRKEFPLRESSLLGTDIIIGVRFIDNETEFFIATNAEVIHDLRVVKERNILNAKNKGIEPNPRSDPWWETAKNKDSIYYSKWDKFP